MKILELINKLPNKNVLLISFGFFWLFGGFAAAQQYLVPLLALQKRTEIAFLSLLIIYISFLFANIFVPKFIFLFGLRNTLVFGAAFYASFILSIATNANTAIVYLTSFLAGVGSAMVWIASGEVMAQFSKETHHGTNLGFQALFYWLGSWMGVAVGGYFLSYLSVMELYFYFFIASVISLLFFWNIKTEKINFESKGLQLRFLFDKRLLFLFPLVFSSFFISGLGFSAINLIILPFGLAFIGLLATIGQISRIIGSFSSGWLSDKIAKEKLLYLIVFLTIIGVGLIFFSQNKVSIIVGTILLGIAHPAVYPVSLALLKNKFPPNQYRDAISAFFFYTGLGSVGALLSSMLLDTKDSFIPGFIFLCLSIPFLYIFYRTKF